MVTCKRSAATIVALAVVCTLYFHSLQAQNNVSIGTSQIKDKAILWLKGNGTNQGLLVPVVANRTAFTGLNNSDDKGMIIFDLSDNNVYYWNGTEWKAAGTSGGSGNQQLTLNGNTFTLTGTPTSTVALSSGTLTAGQALVWDGAAWKATSLGGDVTGTHGATQVGGLKGKTLPALPSSSQALVYDGTSWVFKAGGNGDLLSTNNLSDVANVATARTNLGLGTLATKTTIVNADVAAGAAIAVNKLAPGANGNVLTTTGGVATWQAPTGLTNPMTTAGDLIIGGASGTPGRLGIGTNGQILTLSAGLPSWQNAPAPSGAASGDLSGTYPGPTISSSAATGGNIITAINAAATSINGARVNPAFGAQTVSTTGTGTFGGGLTSGGSSQFTINATGNITKINNIATSFPSTQGANGSVLTNNGAGVLTWVPAGATFSTANIVPKGDGTSGLIASSIFDNGTAVGIGTTTPLNRFQVQSTLTGTALTTPPLVRFANTTANGNTKVILGTDNTTADAFSTFTAGSGASSQILGFGVGNASTTPTQLNITGNGDVGIGSTSPAYKLDVSGNIMNTNPTEGAIGLSGDLPGYGTGVYPTLKTTGNYLYFSAGNKYCAYIDGAGEPAFVMLNTATAYGVYLSTVGNSWLNGGNVGIGTTNPTYLLDLNGNYTFNATSTATGVNVSASVYGVYALSAGGLAYGVYGNNTSTFGVGAGGIHNGSGYGIFGSNNTGNYAGYFAGPVYTSVNYQSSDEKLKENIRAFDERSIDLLKKINIKSYNYRTEGEFESMNLPQGEQVGLLANDLEKIMPHLVKQSYHMKNAAEPGGPNAEAKRYETKEEIDANLIPFKAVNYTGLIPYLIKAVQEQEDSISILKERIKLLEEKTRNIDQVFSQLEAMKKDLDEQRALLGMQAKRDD